MVDRLREFECVTADGPETVVILDIIVWEGQLHLVCKGAREKPYVFEVAHKNSMRAAHPGRASQVLAVHREEVLKWQHETTSS